MPTMKDSSAKAGECQHAPVPHRHEPQRGRDRKQQRLHRRTGRMDDRAAFERTQRLRMHEDAGDLPHRIPARQRHRLREAILVGQHGADQHDAAAERALEGRPSPLRCPVEHLPKRNVVVAAAERVLDQAVLHAEVEHARKLADERRHRPVVDAEALVEAAHAAVLVDGKQREAAAAGGRTHRGRDLANASVVARRDAGDDRNLPAGREQCADHRHVAARRECIVRAIRQHDVEADRARLRAGDAGQRICASGRSSSDCGSASESSEGSSMPTIAMLSAAGIGACAASSANFASSSASSRLRNAGTAASAAPKAMRPTATAIAPTGRCDHASSFATRPLEGRLFGARASCRATLVGTIEGVGRAHYTAARCGACYDSRGDRREATVTTTPASGTPPLADATLAQIAASGITRAFPKSTVLIHDGDVGDSLYIILSGRVKVYASNEEGKEVVIDFHGPGEYVGEMSLDGAPRSASVVTTEPTTCAIVNRAQFREFLLSHPDFALHLIEKLIHRVRVATENVKSLALSDVYGRLVRLLNTLAQPANGRVGRAREADAAGDRRARRRVARHDRQADQGPHRRRLSVGRRPHDHDPPEAAARLVAARRANFRHVACRLSIVCGIATPRVRPSTPPHQPAPYGSGSPGRRTRNLEEIAMNREPSTPNARTSPADSSSPPPWS